MMLAVLTTFARVRLVDGVRFQKQQLLHYYNYYMSKKIRDLDALGSSRFASARYMLK